MARRKLTRKQIAAGFGGKKRKKSIRRASATRRVRRSTRRRSVKRTVRRSARRLRGGYRRHKTSFALGAGLVGVKIAASALMGRPGESSHVLADLQGAGPAKALTRIIDRAGIEMGYNPNLSQTYGAGFRGDRLAENVTIGVVGFVGHKLASKYGVNNTLRKLGSPVVI